MTLITTKKSGTALVLSAATLLAIWPLPNTMGARHLMLLTGFIAAAFILLPNRHVFNSRQAWPIYFFFSFFIWLLFHLLIPSNHLAEQWKELTGDWLRNFLASIIGLALGIVLSAPKIHLSPKLQKMQEPVLIWGLAGTTSIFCVRYIFEVFQTGQWIHSDFYMTPYLGKTPLVIFGGLLIPVMLIKALDALQGKERQIWYLYSFIGLLATLLMYYFANTKNGFAMFALLIGAAFLAGVKKLASIRVSLTKVSVFTLLCFVVFGFLINKHLDSNPAWSNLVADYKTSVKIEEHSNWKDEVSPLPTNEYGIPVNGSTYLRVAWARAGLELLIDHPIGYGLINHSFGALAIQKWSDFHKPDGNNRGSTHSGWLDFGLGFGIPGLLMVCIPLAVSYFRARKRLDFWGVYAAWTIPLIGVSYLTTEVCTGHFIELLFFLTAMFSGLTLQNSRGPNGENVG
jgi:uncharacterized protein with PQ loop repeat